jgi:ornithine carbamoyltransferase
MEIQSLKGRDILAIADFSVEELQAVLKLASQLKSGEKTQKKTRDVKVPLSDSDIKRINKSIEILNSKL